MPHQPVAINSAYLASLKDALPILLQCAKDFE